MTALLLAVAISAVAEVPAQNYVTAGVSAVSWPNLTRSGWLDPNDPTAPAVHFGEWSPALVFGYRRNVARAGWAEVALGGSLGLAFAEASGATSIIINGEPSSITRGITSRFMFLTADVRLQRAAGRWRPFAEGGVGYYIEDVSTQLSDGMVETTLFHTDTVGAWLGAGFDYRLAGGVSWECGLSLTARVHVVGFGEPSRARASGGSIGGPVFELAPAASFGWGK